MKNTVILAAFLSIGFESFAEPAFMPQTSLEQITASPLRNGEVAWVKNADGTASAYVGSETETPHALVDLTALRGSSTTVLDPSKYAVSCDDTVTYNGETWHFAWLYGTTILTNHLYVVAPAECVIQEVDFDNVTTGGSLGGLQVKFKTECFANEAKITVWCDQIGTCDIFDLKVHVKRAGDGDGENDLTKMKFMLTDSLGRIDFANIRSWAAACHLGNLGEDWAKYPATNAVNLKNNGLRHGENFVWGMGVSTNLQLTALGRSFMEIHGNGVRGTNGFKICKVFHSPSNYVFVTVATTPAFDDENLIVEYTDTLAGGLGNFYSLVRNKDWGYNIVFANGNGISTNTITIFPGALKNVKEGYLRIHYLDEVTDPFRIEFNVPVYANNGLWVREGPFVREVQTKLTAGAGITIVDNVISAGGGGSEVTVTDQPIPYNEAGVSFTVTSAGTLSFTGTWPTGKPVFIRGSVASGASIGSNVRVLGYGSIPTDQNFQAVAWAVGGTWYVNVISSL